MAIVGWREVSGRSLTHRFGEPPTADRKFIVTLDNTAPSVTELAGAIGIYHGAPHPEFPFITMTEASVSEGSPSPFHAEVTFKYELLDPDDRDPNPLARPDIWSFSTGGAAVPALYYWDGVTQKPLVNSAKDYFEGLTTDESMTRVTITSNVRTFPAGLATAATNRINDQLYLFGNPHTWKCQGITGELKRELVVNDVVEYWQATSVLMFRMSGWDLQLPDMGFNALVGGQKRRVMTFDFENSEWIPSPVPMAHNLHNKGPT